MHPLINEKIINFIHSKKSNFNDGKNISSMNKVKIYLNLFEFFRKNIQFCTEMRMPDLKISAI
jgi:hypothetical protein